MNKISEILYKVAEEYAERANTSSGVDSMIAGEICDAFRRLADALTHNPTNANMKW